MTTSPPLRPSARGKDEIRQANLVAALAAVRASGRSTRTALVKTLGLGRTTVAALLAQLEERGFVSVLEGKADGVGRPSPVVTPSERMGAFAINPEADGLVVAVVSLSGQFVAYERAPLPPTPSPERVTRESARLVARIRRDLPRGSLLCGLALAVPGQVSRQTGRVVSAPRLGWADVDVAGLVAAETNLPVHLGNNSQLAAAAELRWGAAQGVDDFVYLYGGTGGIGGGVVTNGIALRGARGFAGEIGHMRISTEQVADFGGHSGTLEALVRREHLVEAAGLRDADDAELASALVRGGSADAAAIVARQAHLLGVAIGNVANAFDPEAVVLGGFLVTLARLAPEDLRAGIAETAITGLRDSVRIVTTTSARHSRLRGAAELAFAPALADPLGYAPTTP